MSAPRRSLVTVLPAPVSEGDAIARMKTFLTTLEQIAKRVAEGSYLHLAEGTNLQLDAGTRVPPSEVETHGNTL